MALQDIVEQTVAGLGYDLVEVERSAGGLLRVTIDLPWQPGGAERFVNGFAGEMVDITLKQPVGEAGAGKVAANRKKFRGTLEKAGDGWQVVWSDEPEAKPGRKVSRKREPAPLQALGFRLDEVKEARLASIVDFKGRRPRAQAKE
jgi:ribosome maturation factor RimP